MRRIIASVSTLVALAFAAPASPKVPAPAAMPAQAAPSAVVLDTATFAMGCFWCGETQFTQQPGVLSVTSGYTGGKKQHPTYEQVCTGTTGHYESVRVVYDPSKTSYETLLDMFWHGVDPTQADGQFCDRGSQYRSVVFVRDDRQRKAAEEYHQCFWQKSTAHYRAYREGCQRDERLAELWGDKASKPLVH